MRNLRRFFIAAVAWAVLLPSAVSAQDPEPTPPAVFEEFGTDFDSVETAEANASWNGLGLFSDDVNRLLSATAQPVDTTIYGFGDDPNGAPAFQAVGGTPAASGAMAIQLPDDWTPPAEGLGSDLAFAQSAGRQVQPGDVVMFMWVEFTDAYDFDPAQQINEGFPLTLPGLPVWNSSFAGDTWEGANLIPNAIYDGASLTFDVKSYAPPQSFPVVDLPGFYYRSGNVMAMALGVDELEAYAMDQGVVFESALGSLADQPNSLSAPRASAVIPAQSDDPVGDFVFTTTLLTVIAIRWWVHFTRNGLFTPGWIGIIATYTLLTTLIMLARAAFTGSLPPVEATPTEDDTAGEDEENAADDPTDETTSGSDTAQPADEPADDPPADTTTGPTSDGGDSSFPWLIVLLVGLGIAAVGWGLTRTRGGKRNDDEADAGEGGLYITDPTDGVPGSTPPNDPVPKKCGYEVKFDDGGGGTWFDVKGLARDEVACCTYFVEVDSITVLDHVTTSFRQDAPPERLYIPAYEQVINGIDWNGLTATRSGPFGRQDWQHGDGDPIDTTGEGDPTSFFQGHQGEERLDVVAQSLHIELTRVRAWVESGCPGHENRFDARGDVELDVVVSQECTNDDPGPACPVELNAFGGTVVAATGDLGFSTGYANGTDIDELERHLRAYDEMAPEEREHADRPVLDVIGSWDGHDHDSRDKATFPHNSHGSEHPIKDGDRWEASLWTLSASINGQLVPVAVWPTTERVSTAMDVKTSWEVDLAAALSAPNCGDHCAGHPDRQCHGAASFTLVMRGAQSTIDGGDQTWTIVRPDLSTPGHPTLPAGGNAWEIGSAVAPGSTPAP